MQQLVILLLFIYSSTCFGHLYTHPQEVRLRFHCIWLSVLLWLLWCWRVGWQAVCTVWSRLLDSVKSLIVASSWSHIYLLLTIYFPLILSLYTSFSTCCIITIILSLISFGMCIFWLLLFLWLCSRMLRCLLQLLLVHSHASLTCGELNNVDCTNLDRTVRPQSTLQEVAHFASHFI